MNHVNPPAGMVSKTTAFTVQIRDDNRIEEFPFDKQELTVELEMPGSEASGDKDYGQFKRCLIRHLVPSSLMLPGTCD